MRGNYHTSHEERRRFFYALAQIWERKETEVDLINTQLCLRDCHELLEELGYESGSWEYDCEGIWITFYQEGCPNLTMMSDGYIGSLKLFYNPDADDANEERIRELAREHWGKYFPVV